MTCSVLCVRRGVGANNQLMAVESLVFAPFFKETTPNGLIFSYFADSN